MGGLFALDTEVLRGFDEAGAKVFLPVAVDGDAGGQRIARINEPAGQFQPVFGNGVAQVQAVGNSGRQNFRLVRHVVLAGYGQPVLRAFLHRSQASIP